MKNTIKILIALLSFACLLGFFWISRSKNHTQNFNDQRYDSHILEDEFVYNVRMKKPFTRDKYIEFLKEDTLGYKRARFKDTWPTTEIQYEGMSFHVSIAQFENKAQAAEAVFTLRTAVSTGGATINSAFDESVVFGTQYGGQPHRIIVRTNNLVCDISTTNFDDPVLTEKFFLGLAHDVFEEFENAPSVLRE